MWLVRVLVFGSALAGVAGVWLLWQGWTGQEEWRPLVPKREVIWLREVPPLENALRDAEWSWLWSEVAGRRLLRVDEGGRLRPDLVRAWRSYQTTRLFFQTEEDAVEAEQRVRDAGAERWVAWGLSQLEAREDELRVRFDRANHEAAAEVVDLMEDLSLIPLTRFRVVARDHAEQLAREFIEEGTEVSAVKALWLDGFEAFELIVAGGGERVRQELELRLSVRQRLEPQLELTAHGRRLDEMVLEMDLDEKAVWHDGRPFTSADVMELTDRWRAGFGVLPMPLARLGAEEGPWPGSDLFRRIMAWEVRGDHRVAVRFWQPQGSLLAPWTEVPVLRIERGPDQQVGLIGCGPVELQEWTAGERVVLRAAKPVVEAGRDGDSSGQERLRRWLDGPVPEVEWRQLWGFDVTMRRVSMGLIRAVEPAFDGGSLRQWPAEEFMEQSGWEMLDTRCQTDWWLVWLPEDPAAADSALNEGAANARDVVELRRWLGGLIDSERLAGAGGDAVRPLRPWWRADQGEGEEDNNGSGSGEVGPDSSMRVRVVLEIPATGPRSRRWPSELAAIWISQGIEVETRAVGTTDGEPQVAAESGEVVLRARLVGIRPDDALAWMGLWHGAARMDGGDGRMDELIAGFGEAVAQGEGRALAGAVDLRVGRLGWGAGLVREVRRVRLVPDWSFEVDLMANGLPHPKGVLFAPGEVLDVRGDLALRRDEPTGGGCFFGGGLLAEDLWLSRGEPAGGLMVGREVQR